MHCDAPCRLNPAHVHATGGALMNRAAGIFPQISGSVSRIRVLGEGCKFLARSLLEERRENNFTVRGDREQDRRLEMIKQIISIG